MGEHGSIPPDRAAAAVVAVRRLRSRLDGVMPEVTVALATAALRDAANGQDVVCRLERVIGAPVRVLDGQEEARLCFVGQRAGVWTPPGPTLGLDLGGGSLELAVGDERSLHVATSVPVGATRLRGELHLGDPLSAAELRAVQRRTAAAVGAARCLVAEYPGISRRALLSGGTARALGRLATAGKCRGATGSGEVNQVELPAAQVEQLAARLAPMTLAQRMVLPGMPARRAPVIAVGAAVLAEVARQLDIERYIVSDWGLREGALLDALAGR